MSKRINEMNVQRINLPRDLGVGAFLLLVLAANMFVFLVKYSVCRVAPGVARRVIKGGI